MRLSKSVVAGLTAATALVLAPLASRAATDTGNLTVTATVNGSCTIGDATLAFGVYDPAAAAKTGTTSFSVQCTKTTVGTLSFDKGLAATAAGNTRLMKVNPADLDTTALSYELFADSGFTQPLGTTNSIVVNGTGVVQTVDIFGRIPAAQFVAPGDYTDTVVATISF